MRRLLPLRSGWSPSADDGDFYPADLPEEWRLTYFSNEFPAVLLPHDLWRQLGTDAARDWAADTSERFLFFLEDAPGDAGAESRARALSLRQSLGARFGGIIAVEPWPAGIAAGRVLVVGDGAPDPARPATQGIALGVSAEVLGDPRAEAAWIAARTGRPGGSPGGQEATDVALLGACDFATLERWVRLTELLGVA